MASSPDPAGADTFPDVEPTTVRFDPAMLARVKQEAERRGLESVSEYVRQAVAMQLAWDAALEAVRAGADVDALADHERLIALLAEIAGR